MGSPNSMKMLCHPGFPYRTILSAPKSARLPDPFGRSGVHFYLRGSAALWNGLKLLGLKPDETILFPSYCCGIELDVILKAGFQIQFYRVDSSLQVDMVDLRRSIRSKTKALYVIHYFGFPHSLDTLKMFCDEHNLVLIEDCALALYGRFQGKPLGSFGDIAIFSMRKTIGLPAGGALVINNGSLPFPENASPRVLYEVLKSVYLIIHRDLVRFWLFDRIISRLFMGFISPTVTSVYHKMSSDTGTQPYNPSEFFSDWQNAGLSIFSKSLFKLTLHERVVEDRRSHFQSLLETVSQCRRIAPLITYLQDGACPFVFPLIVTGNAPVFVDFCRARGVWADLYWPDLHPKFPALQFPEARWLKQNVVALPVHQGLTAENLVLLKQTILEWEHTDQKEGRIVKDLESSKF